MSLRTRWLTLALAFFLTVCSSLVGRMDLAHADTNYVVQKGDTLWQIAQTHHTSVSNLMHANHMTSTFLSVHQTLSIPSTTESKASTHEQTISLRKSSRITIKPASEKNKVIIHTVRPGDTLWQIATSNHTTVALLMSTNNLSSDLIYPGQKLKVLMGKTTTPTTKSTIKLVTKPVVTHVMATRYRRVGLPVQLIPVYKAAGAKYGIPWTILAAIHRIETHFRTGYVVSSAGAEGPMQFMPSTFLAYAVKAPGQPGRPNINNVDDAIYTAAHMLACDGYLQNPEAALYHYNHSFAYVQEVMLYARLYQV